MIKPGNGEFLDLHLKSFKENSVYKSLVFLKKNKKRIKF